MVSRNLFVLPTYQKPVLQWVIKLLISIILKVWISGSKNFFGKKLCENESVGSVDREAEFVYIQFFMFICGYGYNSYSLFNVVNTSRGPNRGIGGGECGCVYRIFLITASFGYFKTLKEPSGLLKERANYCQVCNLNLKYFAG